MISSIQQLRNKYVEKTIDTFVNHFNEAKITHQEEIIKAYNQGYREGQEDSNLSTINKDVSQFSNGLDYYNNTFKN